MYLSRVEAVLGTDWGTHIEGQKLRDDGDSFKSKLNPNPLFEDWKKKVCTVCTQKLYTYSLIGSLLWSLYLNY